MRKLASIQKIIDIKPIENADNIECATVLGWHLVVKKNEFKVGNLCIYFEVDSLLPALPIFDFLKKDGVKTILGEDQKYHSGYRLRTIKLRGQISQGLCLPISSFPDKLKIQDIWKEGKDVTDKLGVIKYEKYVQINNTKSTRKPVVFPDWLPVKIGMFIKRTFPNLAVKLFGKNLKPFPSFIPKTDEERVQNIPDVLKDNKSKTFYVTEKIDGSSVTIFNYNNEIGVCSRNIWYPMDIENNFWKPVIMSGFDKKIKDFKNYAFQGELVGEGIQGNKLRIKGNKIYFFNIYNISTCKYLDYKEFIKTCKELNIETVPVINDNFKLPKTVDSIVKKATRKSIINKDVFAEGIVIRPLEECKYTGLGRLSFKVINPEFLLRFNE